MTTAITEELIEFRLLTIRHCYEEAARLANAYSDDVNESFRR